MKLVRMLSLGAVLAAAMVSLAAVSVSGAEVRTWTDPTGKFSTQAEFVEMLPGGAKLKRADGALILVPLARLSQADQDYVKQVTSGGPTVPPDPVPPVEVPATSGGLDLSYVTADNFLAVIIHPADVLKLAAVDQMGVKKGIEGEFGSALEALGIGLEDIEEALVLFDPPGEGSGKPEPSGMMIRFAKPVDAKELVAALSEAAPIELTVQGKTIYKNPNPAGADEPVAFQAAANTIVFANEDALAEILSEEPVDSPLTKRLGEVDTDADVVVVVMLDPVRELMDAALKGGGGGSSGFEEEPPLGDEKPASPFDPDPASGEEEEGMASAEAPAMAMPPQLAGLMGIPEMVQSIVVRLDLSDETLLQVILQSADASDATTIHDLLNGGLAFGKMMFAGVRADMEEGMPPGMGKTVTGAIDKLLAALSVSQDADEVVVAVQKLDDLDELIQSIVPLMMMGSGEEKMGEEFGPGIDDGPVPSPFEDEKTPAPFGAEPAPFGVEKEAVPAPFGAEKAPSPF